MQPAIPTSAGKLLDLLAIPVDERDFVHVSGAYELKPGTQLPAPQGVFPRYVEAEGQG